MVTLGEYTDVRERTVHTQRHALCVEHPLVTLGEYTDVRECSQHTQMNYV